MKQWGAPRSGVARHLSFINFTVGRVEYLTEVSATDTSYYYYYCKIVHELCHDLKTDII